MTRDDTSSSDAELLRDARGGDEAAMQALVARHLPWLRQRVRQKLTPNLRRDADSEDMLQDILLEVFRSPAFAQANDTEHLKALLAKTVDRDLLDRVRWAHRKKRDGGREQSLHGDSSWVGARPAASTTRPSQNAQKGEMVDWIRAAMDRLGLEDRQIIELRVWKELDYSAIAQELDLSTDAARMRTQRALKRLAQTVESMKRNL